MPQNSGLMQGKCRVILGVANDRSIAWGIAKACDRVSPAKCIESIPAGVGIERPDVPDISFSHSPAKE